MLKPKAYCAIAKSARRFGSQKKVQRHKTDCHFFTWSLPVHCPVSVMPEAYVKKVNYFYALTLSVFCNTSFKATF